MHYAQLLEYDALFRKLDDYMRLCFTLVAFLSVTKQLGSVLDYVDRRL